MKLTHKMASLPLLALLVAAVYGLIRTGSGTGIPPENERVAATSPSQDVLVDQSPLLNAQALAHMPTSAVELPFARGALQFGDQEMDLAFALAMLDATQHPPVLTTEEKEIQARLQRAENAQASRQAQVVQLTAEDAKASGARKDVLDDQLDLAKAQLELRQDEVDDARQDLIRTGGDPQGRIQAMVQEHEAASRASDATKVAVSESVAVHGLVQRFQQWSVLHQKQLQLWRAKQDAISAATALAKEHDVLEKQMDPQDEKSFAPVVPGAAAGPSNAPGKIGSETSHVESAARLQSTKRRAADRKTLATLDKRIENEKQLVNLYGQWIETVASEQRSLINGGLRGILVILAIAMIGLFLDDWIGSLVGKMPMERRQLESLRTVTRVTLQIVGVLLVLLVLFGSPTQLGTFLGLAGAGLTVALKDFIISFFGWFVLMGKNGIRIGDWVEINGVTGEVVELGVFRTVLLETGNWTDSGHPTGRRVTFTNSFAVEGHYFNFSTSGQWLWDELQIVLPTGRNPYPVVEAIEKKVLEATSEGARQAEQEWKGAAKSRGMHALSAAPAINVKPVIGGTEISVRYITRANERSQLRAKLNHDAVDLLGAAVRPQPDSEAPKPAFKSI
jgi:small-conductance mechanosensitive channel